MEVQPGRIIICAFDPGGTTGWAWYDIDREDMCNLGTREGLRSASTSWGQFGQGAPERHSVDKMVEMTRLCWDWAQPNEEEDTFVVTIEDFILRELNADRELLSPVRLTARYLDRMETGPVRIWTRTSANEAKNTCSDERLRIWNQYDSASGKHARDAQRHAIFIGRKYASDINFRKWAGVGLKKKEQS